MSPALRTELNQLQAKVESLGEQTAFLRSKLREACDVLINLLNTRSPDDYVREACNSIEGILYSIPEDISGESTEHQVG